MLSVKYFINSFVEMLKFVIFAVLTLPSIRAALTREEMTATLIAAKDSGTLEDTFKKYEREQSHFYLSKALADVAKVQARMPKVVSCLRMAHDPFPDDTSRVSYLVHGTFFEISVKTDSESFTNVITSFKSSDIKPLASIRYWTLCRKSRVDILKRVMDKYPELITGDLPSWIASHKFDRNSTNYKLTFEEVFKYLTSFATGDVLESALDIVKRNEHYTVAYKGGSKVMCCKSQDHIPQDLAGRIEALLNLVKTRNAPIREALTFLPTVIIDLMLEYHIYETI